MNLIINILACIGFIIECLCFWKKRKKEIIWFQILANIMYGMSYLFSSSITGSLSAFINATRSYLCKDSKRKVTIVLLLVAYIIISIISYKDIYSLLPGISGIIFTYCIYQKKLIIMRLGNLVATFLWIIYNIHEEIYLLSITTSIIFISTLLSIIKRDVIDNKKKHIKIEVESNIN